MQQIHNPSEDIQKNVEEPVKKVNKFKTKNKMKMKTRSSVPRVNEEENILRNIIETNDDTLLGITKFNTEDKGRGVKVTNQDFQS